MEFTQDAIVKIAEGISCERKNRKYWRTSAHTVMERLMDKISFELDEMSGQQITIDGAYVTEALGDVVENEDLSRFIL